MINQFNEINIDILLAFSFSRVNYLRKQVIGLCEGFKLVNVMGLVL